MVRDDESGSLSDLTPQRESAFEAVAALAEYARAARLTQADELQADVIAFMVLRGSAAHGD